MRSLIFYFLHFLILVCNLLLLFSIGTTLGSSSGCKLVLVNQFLASGLSLKKRKKKLTGIFYHMFSFFLAHKLSILYLIFFCVFKEDCMFGFITCMFACFIQLSCLLPSLASQKPVLIRHTSHVSKSFEAKPVPFVSTIST